MRKWRTRHPCANILHQLKGRKHRTKTAGSEACDLTLEDIKALCEPMICSVTGVPLRWTDIPFDPWRPSIDRINSNKGYVHGNVRLVCTMYNLAKHRWTDEEVLFMASSLVARK